jgi:serine/threonine protein kinase
VLLSDNYNELVDVSRLACTDACNQAAPECKSQLHHQCISRAVVASVVVPPLLQIWSLGITTYELAVGQPPHAELHSLRAALKIPMCDPPSLPHPERYSPELHSFIRSCLVKDYTRRPSAAELLQHPFITRNASSPQILLDMVQKTMQSIESKAANEGMQDALSAAMQGKSVAMPAAHRIQRSASEEQH